MRRLTALMAMVIILGLVNCSIVAKQKHLTEGEIVFLELAPVDPRSLMQGDYMALRFRLATAVHDALPKTAERRPWRHDIEASDGYVVVRLDERDVGTFERLADDRPLAADEMRLRYRVRNGTVKFATNAFFFQEGHGRYYQPARYGRFRVDAKGELLLVAMHDRDLQDLRPSALN